MLSHLSFANIQWTVSGISNDGTIITSITQTLNDGWHTYWKNPGDSGAKASISIHEASVISKGLIFPKPSVITKTIYYIRL